MSAHDNNTPPATRTGQLPLFDAVPDQHAARLSGESCPHRATKIHTINCGAGGVQYREYCLACWADLRGAIKHSVALDELSGEEAPRIDINEVYARREAWQRRAWSNRP